MSFSKYKFQKRFLTYVFAILCLTQLYSSAQLEQVMLPINAKNKKVTFTFFHFAANKTVTFTEVKESIGNSVKQTNALASVSASADSKISFQGGKFIFDKSAAYIIKNSAVSNATKSPRKQKHTLILTDEKGRHAIGYTPNVTEKELGYALKKYLTSSNVKFTSAVIINSGNQSGFYKKNGKYNPYYLKELKKPAKAIIVK